MRCTECLQAFLHHAFREFGFVAVATQVTEVKMAQIGRHDFCDAIGGGFVREMTVTAEDALLDAPRTAGVVLEQFHVVVRFEHESVRAADAI